MADITVDVGQMYGDVRQLQTEMKEVQEGVSNFRDHAARADEFFTSAKAVWKADSTRRDRNLKVWLVLIPILLGALGWGIITGYNLITELLRIEQQWQTAHPSEFVKPQSFFSAPNSDPVLASSQNQFAGAPEPSTDEIARQSK